MAALTAIRMPENGSFKTAQYCDIIDQIVLPHQIRYIRIDSVQGAFNAIRSMQIRGAPAIASLAALGIACELLKLGKVSNNQDVSRRVADWCHYLLTSRPTAVNLREALDRIQTALRELSNLPVNDFVDKLIDTCLSVWSLDVDRNYTMGDNGAKWLLSNLEAEGVIELNGKVNVLTVCNTGALATSAYGTALGMITTLHKLGRLNHAFFAQTGPYQQGARLTSLELQAMKISCTMIPDTAIAALLQGKSGHTIHAFIAGADRIAANGDTANKISTFQISTLCKAIPARFTPKVIICAPLTTLDLSMSDGSSIVVEERPEIEACTVTGKRFYKDRQNDEHEVGEPITVLFTPPGTRAWNPAFDVTPAHLIDAIVTEIGVAQKGTQTSFDLIDFVKS